MSAADLRLIPADRLQKTFSNWTVIDARPKDKWRAGHVPGALSFSWEDYTITDEKKIPYRNMPPDILAAAIGDMGINTHTPIVVYGDADTSWGGEGWACWTFAWLGHQGPIRLLKGGIQAWEESGFELQTGGESVTGAAGIYTYQIRGDLTITAEKIQADPKAFQLVDTRSLMEWIRGRIPGAVHISWKKFYKNNSRQPITDNEIRSLLLEHDINPEKPIVYYCTGGIRSGYAWLAHSLAGLPAAINFEGGMAEWEKLIKH